MSNKLDYQRTLGRFKYEKVSEQGNILEVTRLSHKSKGSPIRKLNKDEYVNVDTGELGKYAHQETRADNVKTVRETLKRLRGIINTNVTEPSNASWVTLTYAENMTDTKRLYADFKAFWKRFLRSYPSRNPNYIVVMEPQGRGAWHAHLIIVWDGKAPFVENKKLRDLWGHGFVNVQSLKDVDNIGAYLSAYLGDMEVKAGTEGAVEKTTRDGKKKAILKGERLKLYPAGMNIYRTSRGIKKPDERWVEPDELEAIIGGQEPVYVSEHEFDNPETGFKVLVRHEQYNRLRVSTQEAGQGVKR